MDPLSSSHLPCAGGGFNFCRIDPDYLRVCWVCEALFSLGLPLRYLC